MLPRDPFMLLSYVNTKLRDEYTSLDNLCASLDINKDTLISTLRAVGFEYIPSLNQFK